MITLLILVVTALISLLAFQSGAMTDRLVFQPYRIKRNHEYYRFLSYGLIHADWMHLAVNMFVLYSFGQTVEGVYKVIFAGNATVCFLLLYAGGLSLSTLSSYVKHREHEYYHAVGASGAVSAVVFASILFYPAGKIGILFLPFEIPAVIFGILYLVYSAYMAKRGQDNIGHDAHFWGAVFGVCFTILLKPSLAIRFIDQVTSLF